MTEFNKENAYDVGVRLRFTWHITIQAAMRRHQKKTWKSRSRSTCRTASVRRRLRYTSVSESAKRKREWSVMIRKLMVAGLVVAASLIAKADYWMTFCKTPGGQQYSQVGYAKPDDDGFVTVKAGPITVIAYKTQVWYMKIPGEAPRMP